MARINVGPIISDIRGATQHGTAAKPATGATIFARNRGGLYARPWALPGNPQTPQQQNWREYWSDAVADYQYSLSVQQMTDWTRAGAQKILPNTLGTAHTLTGQQMFLYINQRLAASGAPYILDAPPTSPAQDPGQLSGSADSVTPQLILNTQNALPPNHGCIIRGTAAFSQARTYFKNRLSQLWLPPATTWNPSLTSSGPVPPWQATPTFNAAHWTASSSGTTYTATTGQQDIAAGLNSDLHQISVSATIPNLTNRHWICSFRLDTGTGAAYLIGFDPGPPATIQLAKRSTWTATPTVLATAPQTTSPAVANYYTIRAQANTITWTTNWTSATTLLDSTFREGDFGLSPSNGPILYQSASDYTNLEPLPTPGDITAQYLQKFGALYADTRIGLEIRYVNWRSGDTSGARSLLLDVS